MEMKRKPSRGKTAKKMPRPNFIVGLGASAGGLSALEKFFDNMPSDSGMAFVVIQHLSPDFKSLMDDLLARHTEMAIHRVSNGIALQPDSIYLIPPKSYMTVSKGKLYLTERESGQHLHLPFDVFLSSLAEAAEDKAIAVVLSGTGSDGSRGIRDIHARGGLVLAQEITSAQFDGMPRSALETGVCGLVLAPEEMPEAIINYVSVPQPERREVLERYLKDQHHGEFRQVFSLLRGQYNIDFSKYKPPTVGRRIQRRMEFRRLHDVNAYASLLARDAEELDHLYQDLLIGVTEFFRDPKAFQVLADTVIPRLFEERAGEDIRVWTAGCATGEEAYSLAILLSEAAEQYRFKGNITVFATDVHRSSLDTASQGIYEAGRLKNVSPERLARHFRPEGEDRYRVSQALRKMIVFAPHNLISDPPFTRIDLVCCRNLLIYFQPELQDKVIALFHFALRLGGVLFLGSSEGLGKFSGDFETLDSPAKLFTKNHDLRLAVDMRMDPGAKSPGPAAGGVTTHRLNVTLDRQLVQDYDALLHRYVPAGVLVNENRQILHCFGDISKLLGRPEGRFDNDVLTLVHEDLQVPLSTALHRAEKNCSTINTRNLLVGGEGKQRQPCDLKVECLPDDKSHSNHFFITLSPVSVPQKTTAPEPRAREAEPGEEFSELLQQRNVELELELKVAKENLQATIEELQTSNEELQATNEELLASNEELQSTNEELHSVNEELYTVNAEYEIKNKELHQLNQDHENLLASTHVGIVYLDEELRIRKFSPAIERFFKMLPQDIGRPIDHLAYHLDNQETLIKDVRQVLETETMIEREFQAPDGQWLLKRVLPFRNESNEVEGVVLTFTDITRLKVAEQQSLELNRNLERKVEERTRECREAMVAAAEANNAKSIFLANMSHEIRTPMSGIFGTIQLFETTRLSREQADYLQTMRTSADNLLAILDDILDFSKIEAGKTDLVPEPFTVRETVEEVLKLHRPRLEAKGLRCQVGFPPELPELLVGDPLRLKQVLSNLVANAIKFTDEGGIDLTVQVVSAGVETRTLQFAIRDTGIGLAPDLVESIFEPFVQADPSVTRQFGGTGLGLAICKKLVELMGGRIWCENAPDGRGAIFRFTVGLELPRPEATAAGSATDRPAESPESLAEMHILVAEDDMLNRNLIGQVFSKFGHCAQIVRNGREALDWVSKEPVDIVFMDVSMPVMDGVTAATKIRELGEQHPASKVPIIALTAHAMEEDRQKFLAAGMNEVLTKPLNIQSLLEMLRRFTPVPEPPADGESESA